jgi:hypothetical protein
MVQGYRQPVAQALPKGKFPMNFAERMITLSRDRARCYEESGCYISY